MDVGIENIFRETFRSSLAMSKSVLTNLGFDESEIESVGDEFRTRDTRLMREQHAIYHSEEQLIQSAKDTADEFDSLLKGDITR